MLDESHDRAEAFRESPGLLLEHDPRMVEPAERRLLIDTLDAVRLPAVAEFIANLQQSVVLAHH